MAFTVFAAKRSDVRITAEGKKMLAEIAVVDEEDRLYRRDTRGDERPDGGGHTARAARSAWREETRRGHA